MPAPTDPRLSVFLDHSRHFGQFTYVYPVVSRRSRGLSIGINLSPNQACNFDCIYCCVNRGGPRPQDACHIDLAVLRDELEAMLQLAASGAIWDDPKFCQTPDDYRRLADIAFSGDGEPTASPAFPEAVDLAIHARRRLAPPQTKMVLITNATLLQREPVAEALARLDANQGEVWAKLDAGSLDYFQLVNRSRLPLDRVVQNILACGQVRPIIIQTMLLSLLGKPMPMIEFEAYLDRLDDLVRQGCRIQAVHLYTVARDPTEKWVEPVDEPTMHRFAERLRSRLPQLDVQTFL